MKLRKFLSAALTASVLCSLLVLPQASAAGSPGFVDIPDPDIAEAAALLQIMEVVDGNGSGYFFPEMELTRAQFRDMLGTSRKYALAVLEYYDKNKILKKDGDIRRPGPAFSALGEPEAPEEPAEV